MYGGKWDRQTKGNETMPREAEKYAAPGGEAGGRGGSVMGGAAENSKEMAEAEEIPHRYEKKKKKVCIKADIF